MQNEKEIELERLLVEAATKPEERPAFTKLLLNSTVYVLGTTGEGAGARVLQTGEKLHLVKWQRDGGEPCIPFFTSLETLQKSIESAQSYLAIPARDLFDVTQGAHLFLNPKSEHAKEFLPHEISNMLETGFGQKPNTYIVEKSTQVLLGQPKNYPNEMVEAIKKICAKYSEISQAYVGTIINPLGSDKPDFVVGIEIVGSEETIKTTMQAIGQVAGDTVPKDEFVNLVRIKKGDEGIGGYFYDSCQPFYLKKDSSFFKSLIQRFA
jgi:Ca2+/Na+ antiporter